MQLTLLGAASKPLFDLRNVALLVFLVGLTDCPPWAANQLRPPTGGTTACPRVYASPPGLLLAWPARLSPSRTVVDVAPDLQVGAYQLDSAFLRVGVDGVELLAVVR